MKETLSQSIKKILASALLGVSVGFFATSAQALEVYTNQTITAHVPNGFDPDGDVLTYRWEIQDENGDVIYVANGTTTKVIKLANLPLVETKNYYLSMVVNDGIIDTETPLVRGFHVLAPDTPVETEALRAWDNFNVYISGKGTDHPYVSLMNSPDPASPSFDFPNQKFVTAFPDWDQTQSQPRIDLVFYKTMENNHSSGFEGINEIGRLDFTVINIDRESSLQGHNSTPVSFFKDLSMINDTLWLQNNGGISRALIEFPSLHTVSNRFIVEGPQVPKFGTSVSFSEVYINTLLVDMRNLSDSNVFTRFILSVPPEGKQYIIPAPTNSEFCSNILQNDIPLSGVTYEQICNDNPTGFANSIDTSEKGDIVLAKDNPYKITLLQTGTTTDGKRVFITLPDIDGWAQYSLRKSKLPVGANSLDGKANTDILATYDPTSAAAKCRHLGAEWHLPSYQEAEQYMNGIFPTLTSTEVDMDNAQIYVPENGGPVKAPKSSPYPVPQDRWPFKCLLVH